MENLQLMRECLRKQARMQRDRDKIVLNHRTPPVVLRMSDPTAFMKEQKQGMYYTVGEVWLQFDRRKDKYADYKAEADRLGIGTVTRTEKDIVVNYLKGVEAPKHVDSSFTLKSRKRSQSRSASVRRSRSASRM